MLVLSRKVGERIEIGDNVMVTVTRVHGNRVTLGIEAPAEIRIGRSGAPNLVGPPNNATPPAEAVGELAGQVDRPPPN